MGKRGDTSFLDINIGNIIIGKQDRGGMREQHVAKCISLSEKTYNKLRGYMESTKTSGFSEAITSIIIDMIPTEEEVSRTYEYMEYMRKSGEPMGFHEARETLYRLGYARFLEIQERDKVKELLQ